MVLVEFFCRLKTALFVPVRYLPRGCRLPPVEFDGRDVGALNSSTDRDLIEAKLKLSLFDKSGGIGEKNQSGQDQPLRNGEDNSRNSYVDFKVHHEERRKEVRAERSRRKSTPHEIETLLTWAAMNQIRELHENDPETWTAERIAHSFPVSVRGAKNFLRGKRPKDASEERIREHDKNVKRRWEALTSDDPRKATDVSSSTKFLLETGQTKYLPMKAYHPKQIESSDEGIHLELNKMINAPGDGPFTLMYKRHLRWKNTMKLDDSPEKLKLPTLNNDELIFEPEEVLQSLAYKTLNSKKLRGRSNDEQLFNEDDRIIMTFKEFRQKIKANMKKSKNRVDQRYGRWIEEASNSN